MFFQLGVQNKKPVLLATLMIIATFPMTAPAELLKTFVKYILLITLS